MTTFCGMKWWLRGDVELTTFNGIPSTSILLNSISPLVSASTESEETPDIELYSEQHV